MKKRPAGRTGHILGKQEPFALWIETAQFISHAPCVRADRIAVHDDAELIIHILPFPAAQPLPRKRIPLSEQENTGNIPATPGRRRVKGKTKAARPISSRGAPIHTAVFFAVRQQSESASFSFSKLSSLIACSIRQASCSATSGSTPAAVSRSVKKR